MKSFKIYQTIALIAILCHQSFSRPREKRSFWPSFFGGGSTDVVENVEPEVEAPVQELQVPPQAQHVDLPTHNLSPGYHYPIWRVHKYNGIELKPMPISLVPQQHLQQLHTQVPYSHLQQRPQFHQLQPGQGQQIQTVGGQKPNLQANQQPRRKSRCKKRAAIPPELQELAQQFGIKDASKLPSIEDAMGLLGTTTREETIQTIKELADTPDGMNLIRQFLTTEQGAAASAEPDEDEDCGDESELIDSQRPNTSPQRHPFLPNPNFQQRPFTPIQSSIPIQHPAYPYPYPPQQHEMYGLPNAHQAVSFQAAESLNQANYPPYANSHNEAAAHEEYGVPSELSTAHSEHQGYNLPTQNSAASQVGHEIYGLPNTKSPPPFRQHYYAPRSNHAESSSSEGVLHNGYGVPNEASSSSHETQELPQGYGVPHSEESHASAQHDTYGPPNVQEPANFLQQDGFPPKTDNVVPHQEYAVPHREESHGSAQHDTYGLPNVQEPANFLQQDGYPPKTDNVVPHQEYAVPHREESHASAQHGTYGLPNVQEPANFLQQDGYPPKTDNVVPHEEYSVPHSEESHGSAHDTYGLPNVQEPANFLQQDAYPPKTDDVVPHQEYGVPHNEESSASAQHEIYGLPNVREPVDFLRQGLYPPKTESEESANGEGVGTPHQEYNVPNENIQQTQVPHEVYGIPSDYQIPPSTDNNHPFIQPHETYGVPQQDENVLQPPQTTYGVANNDNVQHDQQVPHEEYAVPSFAESSNAVQSNVPHDTYALPHQRFFDASNIVMQPQSTQYGAPTQYTSNNQITSVPILRQIGSTLDRAHTNLELGQLLTTTLRPDAGFLERVGAWTRYFAPPGPTIPITPPQVTEDVNETVDHSQNAYTIPIPKIPELHEPHIQGLPNTPSAPQLPNVYIPRKFVTPPNLNQGPFVRVQFPLSGYTPLSDYELPHQQPQPFDGQTVEEFVPDISQLPLDQRNLGSDLRTSYGIPTHSHSFAGDSVPAASETDEQHVSVALPNQSAKHLPNIDNEEVVENDVDDEEETQPKYYGPQRISSYDSYATGKLNRASDDAIIRLIPTQKPHTNQARRMGQVEDASIIDAIATMTSGFRPM